MLYKSPTVLVISLALIVIAPGTALAETREEKRVTESADVLDQFLRIPEQSIPPTLLSRAYAVAVIPGVIKASLTVGARHGKGILVVRQDDGAWSNPAFIALTGGSVGFQVGVQSTDVILVFKTRRGVDGIAKGKLTLGADASVAAGPVGRHTGAATDLAFKSEVVSYSRSRGLFAGVALEGAGVTMDRKANAAFYGSSTITPEKIFAGGSDIVAPEVAGRFVRLLTAQTSRLPTQPGMRTGRPAEAEPAKQSTVRTFGIPDPDENAADEDLLRYDTGY